MLTREEKLVLLIEEDRNPVLVFRKPLAHFRRNLEVPDLQLDDLVVR